MSVQQEQDGAAVEDQRRRQLEQWLRAQLGVSVSGTPASSDASFRRYFRYTLPDRSLIAMDAPPETEDCRPFVEITHRLAAAGVTVPEIVAENVERGFLLLADLGQQTLLEHIQQQRMTEAEAGPLFEQALQQLLLMQAQADSRGLPEYDRALLQRELDLFPEWYIARELGKPLTSEISGILAALAEQLLPSILQQQCVFVHRDFMPRNLMVMDGALGVIDYQDAVHGPISYDPVCLFRDAFISWPETQVRRWLQDYWQRAQALHLPVPGEFEAFYRDCDYMAVQRHLKVIGIFARICHRDGKPRYLADAPRFFAYLSGVAARRPELRALQRLLDWTGQASQ